jgi:hypothetical protein
MRHVSPTLIFAALLLMAAPALADDWSAARLRGFVVANDVHGTQQWAKLARGDIVSDDRIIRTMATGYVTLMRGDETISFAPNTQGEIVDRPGQRYTTVVQQVGEVSIEAEAREVQHFAVTTPFLVAVVKGTAFNVATDRTSSRVRVTRGLVQVLDAEKHRQYMVPAGQTVTVAAGGAVSVSGQPDAGMTHPVVNGVVEDDDGGAVGAVGNTVGGVVGGVTGAVGNTVGGTLGTTVATVGSTVGGAVGSATSTVGGTVTKTVATTTSTVGGVLHGLGL